MENNLALYIPSMSRHDNFQKGTLSWIPKEIKVNIVVPQEQVASYLDVINKSPRRKISVLGCPEKGIAKTREWIGKHAESRGFKKFVMMDDDLKFAARAVDSLDGKEKLFPCDEFLMFDLFQFVSMQLDEYAAVGVSPRQGNNRCEDNFMENTRLIRFLGFQTEHFLACEHGRTLVMEDFDVLLQLLRKGLKNFSIFSFCQDQNETQAKGGCSDYRTHENHEASAVKLAELHDGFVKLREKNNKTGGEFGKRTEVTIYWKKAFLSSQG